jgi:hypothetical protein
MGNGVSCVKRGFLFRDEFVVFFFLFCKSLPSAKLLSEADGLGLVSSAALLADAAGDGGDEALGGTDAAHVGQGALGGKTLGETGLLCRVLA